MSGEPEKSAKPAASEPELDRAQLLKLAIELGPLLVFLLVWMVAGIKWATGIIMIASVIAMVASQRLLGRISPALVASTLLVVAFGGLTLLLDDPRFIMLKPTMVYLLFAAALGVGLLLERPVLQLLLGETLRLTDAGWRVMSGRWALFFLAMAVLNEIVRLGFTERVWVIFKVVGFPALTIAFVISQAKLIERYAPKSSD